MKVAFTLDFRNAPQRRRPWREFWEDNLWLMGEAEAMGFDTLQVQEHFFTDDGYGPSMPVFLSVLADRTSRVRLMAYIYVLPLRNPAQLAQETAVLDHLCQGRLDVGVGIGHRALEYRAFDVAPNTRGARMEEGLEVLKLAWSARPFSYRGRFYSFDEIEVRPEPFQDPHPPIWVGATTARAARASRTSRRSPGPRLGRTVGRGSVQGRPGRRRPRPRFGTDQLRPVRLAHLRRARHCLGTKQRALSISLGLLPQDPG